MNPSSEWGGSLPVLPSMQSSSDSMKIWAKNNNVSTESLSKWLSTFLRTDIAQVVMPAETVATLYDKEDYEAIRKRIIDSIHRVHEGHTFPPSIIEHIFIRKAARLNILYGNNFQRVYRLADEQTRGNLGFLSRSMGLKSESPHNVDRNEITLYKAACAHPVSTAIVSLELAHSKEFESNHWLGKFLYPPMLHPSFAALLPTTEDFWDHLILRAMATYIAEASVYPRRATIFEVHQHLEMLIRIHRSHEFQRDHLIHCIERNRLYPGQQWLPKLTYVADSILNVVTASQPSA